MQASAGWLRQRAWRGALVELLGLGAVEGEAEEDEGVGHALHAEADGPVAHVAVARRFYRVLVDVDDLVEVARHARRDGGELVEVEEAVGGVEGAHELLGLVLAAAVALPHKPARLSALSGARTQRATAARPTTENRCGVQQTKP